MLTTPPLGLLQSLGLYGMAKAFKDLEARPGSRKLSHAKWLTVLLEQESAQRKLKRLQTRSRFAKLRILARLEDADDFARRGLDNSVLHELAACNWIKARHNVLITGPHGVGKSWLACALGYRALLDDFSVAYHRAPRLFSALAAARAEGRYNRALRAIARLDLLILEDWGPETLNSDQRRDLLEIIEDRHESRSTIVTSQLPVDSWYGIIGNPVIADTILDRLVHNAYRIELKGESLRSGRQAGRSPEFLPPYPHGQTP